jgi:hypothetical protein
MNSESPISVIATTRSGKCERGGAALKSLASLLLAHPSRLCFGAILKIVAENGGR